MAAVEVPGVGDRKRLKDAADRDARFGPEEQVEMVGHQAVGIEAEGISDLGFGQVVEEGLVVGVVVEDDLSVVAAVDGVVEQAVIVKSWSASHDGQCRNCVRSEKGKRQMTPIFPLLMLHPTIDLRKSN